MYQRTSWPEEIFALIQFLDPFNCIVLERGTRMERVRLNPEAEDVGKTFKIIAISITLILNSTVFIWFFFYSGLR